MKLSPAGVHLIAGFEGFSPVCYDDGGEAGKGNCTIGFGHLIHLGPTTPADRAKWGTLTDAQGLALLEHDTAYYAAAVTSAVKVSLGILPSRRQARFDALCSFTYNVGVGALTRSSLLRIINAKGAPRNWTVCGPAWLAWSYPGLLSRRQREFAIFAPGRY